MLLINQKKSRIIKLGISILTGVMLTLLTISCKHKAVEVPVIEIPEEFVVFYENFHTDSVFQLEHIQFPLEGNGQKGKWTKDSWSLHIPFDSQKGEYRREIAMIGSMVVELMRHKDDFVIIERRFVPNSNGSYTLIYYNIESQFGTKES